MWSCPCCSLDRLEVIAEVKTFQLSIRKNAKRAGTMPYLLADSCWAIVMRLQKQVERPFEGAIDWYSRIGVSGRSFSCISG